MRSGYHDTGIAFIVAGREGKCRYRHQRVIDPDMDTVSGKDACGSFGKYIAF